MSYYRPKALQVWSLPTSNIISCHSHLSFTALLARVFFQFLQHQKDFPILGSLYMLFYLKKLIPYHQLSQLLFTFWLKYYHTHPFLKFFFLALFFVFFITFVTICNCFVYFCFTLCFYLFLLGSLSVQAVPISFR